MPQNPRENLDPNIDLSRADGASNTSPVSESNTHVRMDQDDLHEERIERLGQFLSDSTYGTITEDVKHPGKNFFPISGGSQQEATVTVGEGPSDQVKYTDLIDAAKKEFNELKNATSFDADVLGSAEERPSGHYLLEGGPKSSVGGSAPTLHDGAHSYVEDQVKNAAATSRWASVRQRTISSGTQEANPFFNRPVGGGSTLPGEFASKNISGESQTAHSSVQAYSHGGSFGQYENRNTEEFWDNYFERMSRVGAAMTIKATGRDEATFKSEDDTSAKALARLGLQNIGTIGLGEGTMFGYPEENQLGNHYL